MEAVSFHVTPDGERFIDGEPISFQVLVERFCVGTPPDLRVHLRSGYNRENFLLMLSVELVGRQRFYTEYGTNLDEMTKEFVRKWDEFEMAIYREQNPEEEHP